jgi:hypothetical protein
LKNLKKKSFEKKFDWTFFNLVDLAKGSEPPILYFVEFIFLKDQTDQIAEKKPSRFAE